MRLAHYALLLLTAYLLLPSTDALYAQPRPQLTFDHMDRENGLAHGNVSSLLLDVEGQLWIGTHNGLNRYDAARMETFRSGPRPGRLQNNNITTLGQTYAGTLYVGTTVGLSVYDRGQRSFRTLSIAPSPEVPEAGGAYTVSAIVARGKSEQIWVGTANDGLLLLDAASGVLHPIPVRADGRSINKIYAVAEGRGGELLLGTDQQLLAFDPSSGRTTPYVFIRAGRPQVVTGAIGTIFRDQQDGLWVGTTQGLFQGSAKGEKVTAYPDVAGGLDENAIIRTISEDADGRLWIGTDGRGLLIIDGDAVHQYKPEEGNPTSISSSTIYSILHGEDGIAWLGHYGGGISVYDPLTSFFTNYVNEPGKDGSLSNSNVRSLYQTRDGTIWAGTRRGLNRYDEKTQTFRRYTHQQAGQADFAQAIVISLMEDRRRQLWIGTFGDGLARLDPSTGEAVFFTADPHDPLALSNNNVYSLLELSDGLLVGTQGQLHRYRTATEAFSPVQGSFFVQDMVADLNGMIWQATERGLFRYDPKGETNKKIWPADTVDTPIQALYLDRYNVLWMGVRDRGLVSLNPDGTFHDHSPSGLNVSTSVLSITEDKAGNLWQGTFDGLLRLDPAQERWDRYGLADGIQSREFNLQAAIQSETGLLYFGGVNGLTVFDGTAIRPNLRPVRVKITDLEINTDQGTQTDVEYLGKRVTSPGEVTFGPDVNRFTFSFTSDNYTAATKNRFSYRLTGFEEQWHEALPGEDASYTNVGAGSYRFEVRGTNNDGESTGATYVDIIVVPPFYRSWWAILIYFLLAVALIYLYSYFSLQSTKIQNKLKIAELEASQRDELNLLKLRFFTNISHELRTPLTLILTPLTRLLNELPAEGRQRATLEIVHRNASRLRELVNQLMDFRKMENDGIALRLRDGNLAAFLRQVEQDFQALADARNIDFHYYSDVGELWRRFDPDAMGKIMYNLLSNAFKFTPDGGRVSLLLQYTDEKQAPRPVRLTVRDSGRGIEPEQMPYIFDRFYAEPVDQSAAEQRSTGIGLALVKGMVELMGGNIRVESERDDGTRFYVYLPLAAPSTQVPTATPIADTPDNTERSNRPAPVMVGLPIPPFPNAPDKTDYREDEPSLPLLLIVEDNPDIANFLSEDLADRFRVRTAVNGLFGFQRAKELIPDIILTDVMMPELDGFGLLNLLRGEQTTSHIPVVMLTANTNLEEQLRGYRLGVADYIIKPFDIVLLEARLTNVLLTRNRVGEKNRQLVLTATTSAATQPTAEEQFLRSVTEELSRSYGNVDYSVDHLAKALGLSRSVLYRKVKATLDLSPAELIKQFRLNAAYRRLSEQPRITVAEVAYSVGFNDPKYFSKLFKKVFGQPPSEVKRGISQGLEKKNKMS